MTPKLKSLDSSIAFLREGYTFVSSRCDSLGTDLFSTRILGRPVLCMRGAEAARHFYDGDNFTRTGAMPPTVVHLLQDKGSVQTLDDDAHHHRKAAFLEVMAPDSIEHLRTIFRRHWEARAATWTGKTVLQPEVERILTTSACEWAGVPLQENEVPRMTRDLALMVSKAGSVGPGNWWAQLRRRGTEKWVAEKISNYREGALTAPPGSPVEVMARERQLDGELLDVEVAAVELLNLLRPIVAVSRFIVFAAKALTEHPQWNQLFRDNGDHPDLEAFAQEIRRFYPFFPVIAGTCRREFAWSGHQFRPGDWVMLDLYGTNHDAGIWPNPQAFEPVRFRNWDDNPYTLIPQGAGYVADSHRCPGERITLELVKEATRLLSVSGYKVPVQNLTVSLTAFPTMPRSGFIFRA